jgi:Chaperone of endosialidase
MPNPAGPGGPTANSLPPYDPTTLKPTDWGFIDPNTPAGRQAHQQYLANTQAVANNSPVGGGTYTPGGGTPPSSNAFGQVGGYPTGQVPVYNPNDTAITGNPTVGADQNYGLNDVWGRLQGAANNLLPQNYSLSAPQGRAALGSAAQGSASTYQAPQGIASRYNAAQGTGATYNAPQGSASSYNAALGGASSVRDVYGRAALGNAAYADPTHISTAGDLGWQARQGGLADMLTRTALGYGASPADIQLRQGMDDQVAGNLAVLGSQRGSNNFALAQRSAADDRARASAILNQQMGLQRAQETLAAQGMLGNVLGTARGQAQNYNINQADLLQQLRMGNAGFRQGMTLADMNAQNAMTSQNMGLAQQANEFNAGNAQQMTLADMLARNTASQYNATNSQQMDLQNLLSRGQALQTNSANSQQAMLANQASRNDALQYNATNSQQMDLQNLLSRGQALQFNAGQGQAMTLADLVAQNTFGMANVENTQQMDLQNLGLSGQYGLANQQMGFNADNQYYQQLLGLSGAMGGVSDANRAAAAADQQMRMNAALTQYGADSGVAVNNAQSNSNLLGAGVGASAAVLASLITALSDENVKEGIQGGNPMLQSFLEQYRDHSNAGGAVPDSGLEAFERIARMMGGGSRSNAMDAAISGGGTGIAGAIRAMGSKDKQTPGDWFSQLQQHATPRDSSDLNYVGGADLISAARAGQDAQLDPETAMQKKLYGLDWGQSLGNQPQAGIGSSDDLWNSLGRAASFGGNSPYTPAAGSSVADMDPSVVAALIGPGDKSPLDNPSLSDDREKEAVMSGNRGLQAFLEQQNAQTGAQNQQGSYSNAFMQTGAPPSAEADRQLPPFAQPGFDPNANYGQPSLQDLLSAGYGGGGLDTLGGYQSGGFSPGGMTSMGGYSGAGITNPGSYTSARLTDQGGFNGAGISSPGSLQQGGITRGSQILQPGGASGTPMLTAMPIAAPPPWQGLPGDSIWTPSGGVQQLPPQTVAAINNAPKSIGNLVGSFRGPGGLSDERAKTSVEDDPEQMQDFLDRLHAHSYRYKDPDAPGAGHGRYVSPMAQELEKTELGRNFVHEDAGGSKYIDYGKLAGTQLAATAMMHERVSALEKLLKDQVALGER